MAITIALLLIVIGSVLFHWLTPWWLTPLASNWSQMDTTLDIVERLRQEVKKVGFWKNATLRELLTKQLVRDLDSAGICPKGKARDLAQRLVALAKENHESLART